MLRTLNIYKPRTINREHVDRMENKRNKNIVLKSIELTEVSLITFLNGINLGELSDHQKTKSNP